MPHAGRLITPSPRFPFGAKRFMQHESFQRPKQENPADYRDDLPVVISHHNTLACVLSCSS